MDAAWDIQFTEEFRKDLADFKKNGNVGWIAKLDFLKNGPITKNNNLKPLKSRQKSYRWRKGGVRVIFRLLSESKVVLLLRAGVRGSIYNKKIPKKNSASGKLSELYSPSVGPILKDENERSEISPVHNLSSDLFGYDEGEDGVIEELFIDEHELYLLGIPDEYHEPLLKCESIEDAVSLGIRPDIVRDIEEYITSPVTHQIGRVYSLDRLDRVNTIQEKPLQHFLVALDPQQNRIVEKDILNGPWMVRGGPGTGKTLINLARMKRVLDEGIGRDMFSQGGNNIGFITFNKPLSESARTMFGALVRDYKENYVEFTTLDSLVYKLLNGASIRSSNIPKEKILIGLIGKAIDNPNLGAFSSNDLDRLIKNRGFKFLFDEFEEVLLSNDLMKVSDYENFTRSGRRSRVSKQQRPLIHKIFKNWLLELKNHKYTTFSAKRLYVLRGLEKGLIDLPYKFDFLFVDELQDLSVVAIRLLTYLVSDVSRLSFTADTAQSIYLKSPSWSNVSPNIKFTNRNSFILKQSYRMTKQISKAIAPLRLNSGEGEGEDDGVEDALFTGEKPVWLQCDSSRHSEVVSGLISSISHHKKINLSQFAVITPDKSSCTDVSTYLTKAGIPNQIVSRNEKIKLNVSHINIMNVHIAKGLEFPFVFVISVIGDKYPQFAALRGQIDEDQIQEEHEKAKRLLYVALSRASSELWMLTDSRNPSSVLSSLNSQNWELESLEGV